MRLQSVFQQLLGRAPSAGELASATAAVQGGQSASSAVAHSDAAKAAVNAFYQQLFGTDASPADLKSCQDALAAGQSLKDQQAALRPQFAHSQAAQGALNGLYQQVLGRDATASEMAQDKDGLASGASSLSSGRSVLANSPEGKANIASLYLLTRGKVASKDQVDAGAAALASGQSLDQMQHDMAYSKDAQAFINATYQKVVGRPANADEMATAQQITATLRQTPQGGFSFNGTFAGANAHIEVGYVGPTTVTVTDPNSGLKTSMKVAPELDSTGAFDKATNPGFESTFGSLATTAGLAITAATSIAIARKDPTPETKALAAGAVAALAGSEDTQKTLRDLGKLLGDPVSLSPDPEHPVWDPFYNPMWSAPVFGVDDGDPASSPSGSLGYGFNNGPRATPASPDGDGGTPG